MGNNLPFVDVGTEITGETLAIDKIVLGDSISCVLFLNKRVKCWGNNFAGQLGLGDTNNRGDNSNEMGNNLPYISFGNDRLVRQFISGYIHNCAFLGNKNVVCFGINYFGQLGIGNKNSIGDQINEIGNNLIPIDFGTDNTVTSIHTSSTAFHNCAILNEIKLKCWGSNDYGELGLGDTKNRGDEPNEMGDNLPFVDFGSKKVSGVFLGPRHTCLILVDEETLCWGYNGFGQLGIGSTSSIGDNVNEMGKALVPTNWGKKKATSLALGWDITCGLIGIKNVKCFGNNNFGQLGQGNTLVLGITEETIGDNVEIVKLGNMGSIIKIVAGYSHVCAYFEIGKTKCWGSNIYGNLGLNDTNNRGDEPNQMGILLPFTPV